MADESKKTGLLRSTLTLFFITAFASFMLAFVYNTTKAKIKRAENMKKTKSFRAIFPSGNFSTEKQVSGITYVEVKDDKGKLTGFVIFTQGQGYSSTIKIAYGITLDKKIKGLTILSQQETPGLGARSEEIKRDVTLISLIFLF